MLVAFEWWVHQDQLTGEKSSPISLSLIVSQQLRTATFDAGIMGHYLASATGFASDSC